MRVRYSRRISISIFHFGISNASVTFSVTRHGYLPTSTVADNDSYPSPNSTLCGLLYFSFCIASPKLFAGHCRTSDNKRRASRFSFPSVFFFFFMILTLETSQDPNIDLKTPSSPLASPILGSIKVLYTAFTYSEAQRDPDNEPPPEYTPSSKHPTSSSSSSSKTINYVSGYRRIGSLEGKYVIDPTMQIPSALLPPLASGEAEEERKHLCLETKTGSIHADVTLVDRPSSTKALVHKSGRVMMEAKTAASGSIFLKIVSVLYRLKAVLLLFLNAVLPRTQAHLSP